MDPFSAEGELLNIHNAFHQGQYQNVVDFDASALSSENTLTVRVLKIRARVALGETKDVLAEVPEKGDEEPDVAAVRALAQNVAGQQEAALKLAEDLAANYPENATVQVLASTVLAAQDKDEEALSLLEKHQGNLEAVALIIQVHLKQNRVDLALKEVNSAKRWAQDSLLINIAESWVGMRVGGEKYQAAFYVYEELASVPSTSSAMSVVGQAVSEIHQGRLPEAEVALQEALKQYPDNVDVIANTIVLNTLAGKNNTDELKKSLESKQPSHGLLSDLAEKNALFDSAAAKYSPKVSS